MPFGELALPYSSYPAEVELIRLAAPSRAVCDHMPDFVIICIRQLVGYHLLHRTELSPCRWIVLLPAKRPGDAFANFNRAASLAALATASPAAGGCGHCEALMARHDGAGGASQPQSYIATTLEPQWLRNFWNFGRPLHGN